MGRTHVYRSDYGNREIEYTPEPEANTRVAKKLAALAVGIASLNGHSSVRDGEFEDVERVAFDCLDLGLLTGLRGALCVRDSDFDLPQQRHSLLRLIRSHGHDRLSQIP